jgi:hypothetical protein
VSWSHNFSAGSSDGEIVNPTPIVLGSESRFLAAGGIEPLRHPDGYPTYSSRGQLYRTKVGDTDGPVLCKRTLTPTLDSCRALLACSITGLFEAWHEGDSFARLTGDIASVAKLDVKEGPVRFVHDEMTSSVLTHPHRPYADGTIRAGGVVSRRPKISSADLDC